MIAQTPRVEAFAATSPCRPTPVKADRDSGSEILKATAVIGGSSAVNIALGVIRNKAAALLLGPSGVGLMGMYLSIADLTQSMAGLGIQSSGVRQIAEAAGTSETMRIARTAAVLSRVAIGLGLTGAAILLTCAGPIGQITFKSSEHATGVALLSVVVLLRSISAGQSALLQGMRRINDLARVNVLSAVFATVVGIPLIYFWRAAGIVPSLIAVAIVTLITSSWYSHKIRIERAHVTWHQMRQETAALLTLGAAFMATGLLTVGAAYAIRLAVLRKLGFDAAGFYQAAWTIGGLYVAFILQAMGADFYPRLTAVAKDNAACNRLVNEQAHISLLLAGPGVIATMTLAPLVISGFYSPNFAPAVAILRWICLGMVLRVIAWPMGFIIVAKGAQQLMIAAEVAAAVVHVGLAWALVSAIGLEGAGAAFFGLYLWHSLLVFGIVRRVSGFSWSAANRQLRMLYLPLTATVFVSGYLFPTWLATTIGTILSAICCLYSIRSLVTLVPAASIPAVIRSCLSRFGAAPVATPETAVAD